MRTEGAVILREQASPGSSPGSGKVLLYPKADHKLYTKDSVGLEQPVGHDGVLATLANATLITETIVASWALPANFLAAGSILKLDCLGQVSSTATLTYKIRCGTVGAITDALLATFVTSAAGVANAHAGLEAVVHCLTAGTSGTAYAGGLARLVSATLGVATAAFAAATVNTTVANTLSVTVTQSLAQTYTSRTGIMQRIA